MMAIFMYSFPYDCGMVKDRHGSRSSKIFESARCCAPAARHKIHPANRAITRLAHRKACVLNLPERLSSALAPRLASRMDDIEPFHVVVLINRAKELEAQGRSIANMVVGEPDAPTAPLIAAAGIRAIESGRIRYTASLGISELRERIAAWYQVRYGVEIPRSRVIVTAGSSGA